MSDNNTGSEERSDKLQVRLRQLVYDIRKQNYRAVKLETVSITAGLTATYSYVLTNLIGIYGQEGVAQVIGDVNRCIESEDYILLADILENICIPYIEAAETDTDVEDIGRYVLERTSSGFYTIKSKFSGAYIHSTTDPMWESGRLAEDIYDPALRGYIVWGCGLGYFALKLGKLTDGSVPVKVYEEDDEMIRLARDYGFISQAEQYNVTIIHDPNATAFTAEMVKYPDDGVMMHYPSIRKIRDDRIREALMKHYSDSYEPVRVYSGPLKRNYYSNTALGLDSVDKISDMIQGKEVVIVAAGPSLDESIDFLKSSGDRVIISVGTVLKKLLGLSVIPDYCVQLDPYPPVYKQVEGILNSTVPLIIGMSTYWKVGQDYRGEKMIAFMKGMTGNTDYKGKSKYLFEVGSSVTTLAIDIAMQMGASAVYLIGVDMAYRNGMSHTTGTQYQLKSSNDNMLQIESNSGEMVYTTATLNDNKRWIEEEIVKYPHIPVYNLSKTGALIRGARLYG